MSGLSSALRGKGGGPAREAAQQQDDGGRPPRGGSVDPPSTSSRRGRPGAASAAADANIAAEAAVESAGPIRANRMRSPTRSAGGAASKPHPVVAEKVPEVHFIGELLHATGFPKGVACRWRFDDGRFWTILEGDAFGQTHTCYARDGGAAALNHPIEAHYSTHSVQGWPRLQVTVQELDMFGRAHTVGYGFAHLPTMPGQHEFDIPCWRPCGSRTEEVAAFFLGNTPHLTGEDVVYDSAWANRCRIVTAPSGTIRVRMSVVMRHMHEHGVGR